MTALSKLLILLLFMTYNYMRIIVRMWPNDLCSSIIGASLNTLKFLEVFPAAIVFHVRTSVYLLILFLKPSFTVNIGIRVRKDLIFM